MGRSVFFLLPLFFIAIFPIFARGQIEERVDRARKLIQENNLNEAELLLVEIEREDPERQEEVEEMRLLIRTARRGYNQLYAELIQELRTGQNEDRAVDIIRQLESLDSNPNPATARLIFEAKRTVLFKQSQRKFNELMDQALVRLNQGDHLGALSLYQTGFAIHREIFDGEDYDEITKSSVRRQIAQLSALILAANNPQAGYGTLQNQIEANITNPQTPEAAWLTIRQSLLQWQSFFAETETALSALKQQDALLTQAAGLTRGDPYLTFMNGLIAGRDGQGRQEGILGAYFRYFESRLNQITGGLTQQTDRQFQTALGQIESENFTRARGSFETLLQLANVGQGLNSIWTSFLLQQSGLRSNTQELFLSAVSAQERFRYYQRIGRLGVTLTQLREELAPSVQNPPQDLAQLTRVAVLSRNHGNAIQQALQEIQQVGVRQSTLQTSGIPLELPLLASVRNQWQNQVTFFRNSEVNFYDRRAGLVFPGLSRGVENLESGFAESRRLLTGESRRDELGLVYTVKYPRQALERYLAAQQELERLTPEIQNFQSDYRIIADQVPNEPRILRWIDQSSALLVRLNNLRTNIGQDITQARAQVAEAESLLVRAREGIVNAQSALAQQRFRDARAALSNAQSLWEASFLIQDEPELKASLERQRSELAAAILNGEREQVARDVRNFIQQGSQAYLQSRFLQAEEILLRARDRWADTESEPNVEVEQWLGLTRNALTFSSGRELNKTDPLYFEIQPLLNFAAQDFERARQLWQDNRRNEARVLLEQASLRLEQVRIPFPLNQTAGVLQLRILQLTASPDEFNRAFANLFDRARNLSQTNPTQALADLQDLSAIQPNYPGLQALIRQLRITVGLDPPPPNPANLARSRQLTTQADRIVAANQFNRFSEARTLIEEALRLDPTNADAQRLLDRILITGPRTGTAAALTPQERSSLDQAAQLFNQGRFFEAKAIVDRLLATAKNRTNPEILKLQTSINARLRI